MVMYLKRAGGQSQYSVPLAAQARTQSPIARVQTWILDHPEADLSLSALASEAAMSPRNFSRVFRSETGLSPASYVEHVRMDKARRLLEDTHLSLDEVAKRSGLARPPRRAASFCAGSASRCDNIETDSNWARKGQ
jgi:transcriptional regulator GlxA family with amidase domain